MLAPFKIEQDNSVLTSHSGLALVGALLGKTGLRHDLDKYDAESDRCPDIPTFDIISSMTGLICLGKPDYDAVEPSREDPFFKRALELQSCPSSPTLRQRIDGLESCVHEIILENSAQLVGSMAPVITPIKTSAGDFAPLDLDVSPHDNSGSKKEGVSWTYKKCDGYAPMYAYLGQEGYMVNNELRKGKQHCQKGTPYFLDKSIGYSTRITSLPLLVRMDSGNDSIDNREVCRSHGVDFIIKRNHRKESPEKWLEKAQKEGWVAIANERKTVWVGKTYSWLSGETADCPIVFKVTERKQKKGQLLAIPEIKAESYWVSKRLQPSEVIELYHDHGTSEQFHSEIKTDLDLERLPSGKFASNAIILHLGMLTYNILRLCGQESLRYDNGNIDKIPSYRKKVKRRRIRSVMLDLIYMAGKIVNRSRQIRIVFSRINPWAGLWRNLYAAFAY